MVSRLFFTALLLLVPIQLSAQSNEAVSKASRVSARQELETILSETNSLDKNVGYVEIKARAASLLSYSDPARSQNTFVELWQFVKGQSSDDFDKEQAQLTILKHVFVRNPGLAKKLMSQQQSSDKGATTVNDDPRFVSKLATQLVDVDPATAAALLEKSLPVTTTPAGLGALTRLRQKDSMLADYVASKVLEGVVTQESLVSLQAMQFLEAYVFPGTDAPIVSSDAETSLQVLQFKYFSAGYEILKASLTQPNESLPQTPRSPMRAALQGQLAATLAALAPRFHPVLSPELADIATKLSPQIPPQIREMTKFKLAKLAGEITTSQDPEQNFLGALTRGDFVEAEKQLERFKDDTKRTGYGQLLLTTHAKSLLAKLEIFEALTVIRKIDDPTTRLVMYHDAIIASRKKRDRNLTSLLLNEIRPLVPQSDRNGLHVRVLLSLVAQLTDQGLPDSALDFLSNAVVTINALSAKSQDTSTAQSGYSAFIAELNDPRSLVDASELDQAFTKVGLSDVDRSLAQAKRIDFRPVQLMARLEAIQGLIKRVTPEPKKTEQTANTSAIVKH